MKIEIKLEINIPKMKIRKEEQIKIEKTWKLEKIRNKI